LHQPAVPGITLFNLLRPDFHTVCDSSERFSHTLEELLGGQMEAGFLLAGLYEHTNRDRDDGISKYMSDYIKSQISEKK